MKVHNELYCKPEERKLPTSSPVYCDKSQGEVLKASPKAVQFIDKEYIR